MIDKNLFLETLHEVAEIAATSGEKIKPEEVHKYPGDTHLPAGIPSGYF